MVDQSARVVLVTGGSSGIGLAICSHLHSRNFIVYGTSRNPGHQPFPFHMLKMDVTNRESINAAVEEIIEREGKIDVLINNAGLGFNGAVEDATTEEINNIFSTNVTGLINTCQAVLPHMRLAGKGLIINVSSIAGRIGLPFRGVYCASKHAVEAFSESLSMEVKQFGIRVVIVEPGDYKTNINENRRVATASATSVYSSQFSRINDQVIKEVGSARDPREMGVLIEKIIKTKNPALRYTAAPFLQKLSVVLHNLLPGRKFEKIMMRFYKL